MLILPTSKNNKFSLFLSRQTTAYRCSWQTGELSTRVAKFCHFLKLSALCSSLRWRLHSLQKKELVTKLCHVIKSLLRRQQM